MADKKKPGYVTCVADYYEEFVEKVLGIPKAQYRAMIASRESGHGRRSEG